MEENKQIEELQLRVAELTKTNNMLKFQLDAMAHSSFYKDMDLLIKAIDIAEKYDMDSKFRSLIKKKFMDMFTSNLEDDEECKEQTDCQ